jgi:hypothetical protein
MHGSGNWRLPLVPQLGVSPFGQPIDCGRFIFTGPHFVPARGRRSARLKSIVARTSE